MEREERNIPAEYFPRTYFVREGASYPRPVFIFHIPIGGDSSLLRYSPNPRQLWTEEMRIQERSLVFEIVDFSNDPERIKQRVESTKNSLGAQLAYLRAQAQQFNDQLPERVTSHLEGLVDVMTRQAHDLASVSSYYYTSSAAVSLAENLASLTPGDLNRCFFTSSGSEATEAALKLARQYQRLRGEHHRFKFISRYGSYHGSTFGAMSATGRRPRDAMHYPMLPGCVQIRQPIGENDLAAAEELREVIEAEGPETVAAFIAEPVSYPVGLRVPEPEYWPRIREICDEYEVLLIVDEILVGFGRTGRMFAIEHWDVTPDVLLISKAMSAGYAPIGAMVVSDSIFNGFPEEVPFANVLTWGGHAIGAAVADRVLAIYEEEQIVERAHTSGKKLFDRVGKLNDSPIVKDIRSLGLWVGIELMDPVEGTSLAGASTLKGYGSTGRRMIELLHEAGCACGRMSEGVLQVAPPIVASESELDFVASAIETVIERLEPILLRADRY